ncbi:hypothetical protein BDR26DRAFT_855213 [Obelidium mucronatum]|nr:hypothetical protein BDR26DRAFT_855213 [Obelidium mucronatum]
MEGEEEEKEEEEEVPVKKTKGQPVVVDGDDEDDEVEEVQPVVQRNKGQPVVVDDDDDEDDEVEVVQPVGQGKKKRRVEDIIEEEVDEVEDDEDVLDEEEVEAHPKKKRHVMNLLGSDGEEEEAEVKKMVSVKCKFQNQGAVFRCNVEGTVAERNKAKVFLADVLAAAKVHPATTHFRRKVHSVSWFTQEEYFFDDSVLVDIALDPHSPDYFDVAYTDSGRMRFCFNSSLTIFGI